MRVLSITDEGDDPLDTAPLLVARADAPLVRAVLALLTEHLAPRTLSASDIRPLRPVRGPDEEQRP